MQVNHAFKDKRWDCGIKGTAMLYGSVNIRYCHGYNYRGQGIRIEKEFLLFMKSRRKKKQD